MIPAPIPENEEERLVAVHKMAILDTKPEERFDQRGSEKNKCSYLYCNYN